MIVHVVNSNINYDQRVKKEIQSLKKADYNIKVIAKENGDVSISNNGYFQFLVKSLYNLAIFKPSLVHAHDWYGLLPASLYSLLFKTIIIYDAHELFFKRNHTLRSLVVFLIEKVCMKRVSHTICANKYRARLFNIIHKSNNISVLSNKYFKNTLGVCTPINGKEKVDIVYMGSITNSRYIEDWIVSLIDIDNVKVNLIGTGPDYEILKRKYHGRKVKFYGRLTHHEMRNKMFDFDIGIISYNKQGFNNYYCEPNKIGEYAYFGLPFIALNNYTLSLVNEKYEIGTTVDEVSNEKIKEAIDYITNSYCIVYKNLETYLEHENWNKESCKLIALYEEVLE